MLLYNSVIKETDEETYGDIVTRHQLICGDISVPVADLTANDYTGEDQKYFDKNLRVVVTNSKTPDRCTVCRNDNEEPDRRTYAISFRCEEGYELLGVDQRFAANIFAINKNGIDIVGREFPEIYSECTHILRVFTKDADGRYAVVRFIVKDNRIEAIYSYFNHDSDYAKKVLNKRAFTCFIRTFGRSAFINKVKVPPKTRIFIDPSVVEKVSAEKFLKRYFPGGYSPQEYRDYEVWEYNPDALESVVDSILLDEQHPVYQIYFLGYGYENAKVLREITDGGFDRRHRTRARAAKKNKQQSKS